MGRAKLQDVARVAGVSVTTVSRVLNNRGYLSDDVRTRVADAIRELDYRPDEVARSLHGQKTKLVGLIVPTTAEPFFGQIAMEVEVALAAAGYKMLLCNSLSSSERESQYLGLLIANRVDGIITSTHNEGIGLYSRADLPIVALDRPISDSIPNIHSDNYGGGRMATELLVERGCRHIVHITATESERNERALGYRDVMREQNLEPQVFAYGFETPDARRRELLETWLSKNAVDGVFCSDDTTALMVLEWGRAAGRVVPDDLRIVGFDGTKMMQRIVPGLTTVRQPISQIASAAVAVLLGRITDPRTPVTPSMSVTLPVDIHIGWTT